MGKKIKMTVTCIHCLEQGEKDLYITIDGEQDVEIKEKIINEELFLYQCSHCGHYQIITYPCIYVDELRKYIIVIGTDSKQLKKIEYGFKGYKIRVVKELSEMKEKILINENGLDDKIIELMKYNLRIPKLDKVSYQIVLMDNQGLEFVLLYPDNEIIKIFAFSNEDYLTLKNKYIDYLSDEYVVDVLYASKKVLQLNKNN